MTWVTIVAIVGAACILLLARALFIKASRPLCYGKNPDAMEQIEKDCFTCDYYGDCTRY